MFGMGAWGHGTFQNDDALDFLDDVLDGDSGPPEIEEALRVAAEGSSDGILEAPHACAGLAAAELVAAARGAPAPDLPDGAKEWVREQRGLARLAALAIRAAERTRAAGSELRELWDDSGEGDAWLSRVADLVRRLG
jgi:hypothetical protein